MNRVAKVLMLLIGFGLASVSQADLNLSPADCQLGVNCWTSDVNSQPDGDAIEQLVGTETNLFEQYKSEVGGADSGPFAGDYITTYDNEPTDPQDATIVWLEGDIIDCSQECYLAVKDGNHSPSLYVFDITGWDGMMSIVLTGFWPGGGAISNIAIWNGNDIRVPEPGSLALLGIGLLGFGLSRRRSR